VAKKAAKKPEGFRAFDNLTRKLIQVPKEEVEAQIEMGRKTRKKKRRKK